ncbi:hypothetical protein HPB50_017748 [Hyalomma asiaticum]|uniref:Uncharacterized protein n=1 Tax=Hyalomma asiaticum TaxID=266040 RepID=A0ACB7SWY7_HYAAI|nr:hypothetical protein HPB50_017748 [Hyalomma asiaticum]
MATAPCSTDVFEHLDDAAREEAYRSAVSEAAALKTEVDQLRRELERLKMVPSKDHDAANDDDAPKPPLDPQLQASHDFLCNLLAPLIERIERLESRTREDSDAASCTSAGESYASINMKRGSRNQQSQAKGTNTQCMSNDEDARDRLSSFAASSLPHLGKDLNAWFHQVHYWFRTFSVPDEVAVPFIISRLPAEDFTWTRHHTKQSKDGHPQSFIDLCSRRKMPDNSSSLLESLSLSAKTASSPVPYGMFERQHFRNAHETTADDKGSQALSIHRATSLTDARFMRASMTDPSSLPPSGSLLPDAIMHPPDVAALQLRLPTFWRNNPQLWFGQVEATFDLHHTSSEISRFRHLLCNLSPEVAQEVADVIAAPLNDALYQRLKQSILDRTTTSESARLRHLLTTEELGDRRPSQLLNSMRQLLRSSDVDSNGALFRELFLQRLPQSTRPVLAAAGDLTLDRLAQLADRVHDATSATVAALSSTPESSVVSRLESRIDQLAASIDAFRTSPHDHRGVSTRQGHRAFSPSSPRSRSPRDYQHDSQTNVFNSYRAENM